MPSMIMVPTMPLAIPPGMGSSFSMAFIALYAEGVGSVKNDHDSWSKPRTSTSASIAKSGRAVRMASRHTVHIMALSFASRYFVF